jgi:hypothetical protein
MHVHHADISGHSRAHPGMPNSDLLLLLIYMQPIALTRPPQIIHAGMLLSCDGGVGCTRRSSAMPVALAPS